LATELTAEELVELASAPASVSVDGQTVSERSADDVIKLENRAIGKTVLAGANNNGGPRSAFNYCRPGRFKPPGGGPT